MKKLCCLVATVLFLFSSCVSSHYPIDKVPCVQLNPALLGTWKINETSERNNSIIISRKSAYEYMVEYAQGGNKGSEFFNAYISEIDHNYFINFSSAKDAVKDYMFFRILYVSKTGDRFKLAIVGDTTMREVKDAAKIRATISRNLLKSDFYSDTTELFRIR